MYAWSELTAPLISLAAGAIAIITLILLLVVWTQLARLRKNYRQLMNGVNAGNMEDLLIHIQNKVNGNEIKLNENKKMLDELRNKIKSMKCKLGIYRYNAFSDQGSDLSFSVALVDERQDGFVLTGLHSREESYIYAKPIEQGNSKYILTPEEKEAINRSSK
jgi:hypothetical protein